MFKEVYRESEIENIEWHEAPLALIILSKGFVETCGGKSLITLVSYKLCKKKLQT